MGASYVLQRNPGLRHQAVSTELVTEIRVLKAERQAAILAHNYQRPEIQDVADVVADSLRMARRATELDAPVLVICGVHFMAETAAIANPDKRVLRSEEHTSELQSLRHLVCRLLLEKKKLAVRPGVHGRLEGRLGS